MTRGSSLTLLSSIIYSINQFSPIDRFECHCTYMLSYPIQASSQQLECLKLISHLANVGSVNFPPTSHVTVPHILGSLDQ
jgi:hypothetical protein